MRVIRLILKLLLWSCFVLFCSFMILVILVDPHRENFDLDETVNYKGVDFTVEQIEYVDYPYWTLYSKNDYNQLCTITLSIKNNTEKDFYCNSENWRLLAETPKTSQKYNVDITLFAQQKRANELLLSETISPHGIITKKLTFVIPVETSKITLSYSPYVYQDDGQWTGKVSAPVFNFKIKDK